MIYFASRIIPLMSPLKLISWNVNGIRAAEKKGFLDWLANTGADVVAIQETKASPDQLSDKLLKPAGYQSAFASAEKKGYSGVATYSKVAPNAVIVGLGDSQFDTDGRTVITEYDKFVLFNIYFPNGGRGPEWVTHKLAFYRFFLQVVSKYLQQGKSVIATGDVNTSYAEIDIARPKENLNKSGFMPIEREVMGEFFALGLIDTFRMLNPTAVKYTWWDQVTRARERNVGWRLDYFFVSPDLKDKVVSAEIHDDVMGSDHCPISLTVEL
jgi:exodeoxyribonuclease-3